MEEDWKSYKINYENATTGRIGTGKKFFRKGGIYPLSRLPELKATTGKCKFCPANILFAPIIKMMVINFEITGYEAIYSNEKRHSCFDMGKIQ